MPQKWLYFLLGIVFTSQIVLGTDLNDVTATLFPGRIPNHALISAYGDYNADKLIDIFILSDDGRQLDILLAQENKAYTRQSLLYLPEPIRSVTPADFNGDALMDILITQNPEHGQNVSVFVCWGTDENHQQNISRPVLVTHDLNDQPTLFDFNQDMLPDLLVESTDGNRVVYIASSSKNFSRGLFFPEGSESPSKFLHPQSNAYVDVTGDFMADLVLTTVNGYEVWVAEDGILHLNYTVDLPPVEPKPGYKIQFGQAAFSDVDQNGAPNMLVPVCQTNTENGRCTFSQIYGQAHPNGTLNLVLDELKIGSQKWEFMPPGTSVYGAALPITLRFGDYNMDGFPDMILLLHDHGKNATKAILFENVLCAAGTPNCLMNRTFVADLDNEIATYDGVVLGSFFDLYEDGVLDILLVTLTKDHNKVQPMAVVRAIRQTSTTDACFMKVTVTNGLCYKNCLDGRQPYGVNVPGPVVKYSTVSVNGDSQASSATQLSQSAYFALQLPYVLFGLGLTPNFVDTVSVGIPVIEPKKETAAQREWTQIIPNSQLVVIPYPNIEPYRWIVKLFVTPSQSVLITGAALLGTCGFVAGIIGILHWRERREDMKEKRQESHKFHFDAM